MLHETYTLQQLKYLDILSFALLHKIQIKIEVKLLAVCVSSCGITKCAGVCACVFTVFWCF